MDWLDFFFVFLLVWWVTLFTVLPFGVHVKEKPEEGMASSAPEKPRMLLKLAINTVLALVITYIILSYLGT